MLNRYQTACFEKNSIFLDQVAAALLPIASQMLREAIVVETNADATAVEKAFAQARSAIARQILNEQGITLSQVAAFPVPGVTATGGSVAMKYLVQQMLLSAGWTMTADQWATLSATNPDQVQSAITTAMSALLSSMTAIPQVTA